MQQDVPGLSGSLDPSDWRTLHPLEAATASDGLEMLHFRDAMEAEAAELAAGG
jgi:hypothetical protein